MWTEIIVGFVIVLVMMLIGILLAIQVLGYEDRLDLLSIAFPLGSGIYTWLLFIISWTGIRLGILTHLVLGFVLLFFGGTFLLKGKSNFPSQRRGGIGSIARPEQAMLFARVVCLIFVLLMVSLAIGRSYSSWDAMAIWSVKGYGIALEGTILAASDWGEFGLNYPLNTPLLIATFETLGGDRLPGSKAVFPLYYLSLGLGCFIFFSRNKLKLPFAVLGALLVCSTPLVFEHGTIGYANLPFGVFLALGVFHAIRGVLDGDRGRQFVSGILLAFATWTRPEGTIVVLGVILTLYLAFKVSRHGEVHWRYWFGPIVLIAGPWLVFSSQYATDNMIVTATKLAIASIKDGQLRLSSFYRISRFMIRQLLTPSIWGVMFPLGAILLTLNFKKIRPREFPEGFAILLTASAVTLSTVFHFYFVSFLGTLPSWLPTSANRMFLPAAILLASWIFLLAGRELEYGVTVQSQMDSSRE